MTKAPRPRNLDLVPPEGVPLSFPIASYGARFGGQFMDILITYLAAFLVALALIYLGLFDFTTLGTFFALVGFFLRTPYYILAELIWNGRTLGKRIAGTRVISLDGRTLTPHQIVARNVLKEVEVFLPVGLFASFFDAMDAVTLVLTVIFLAVLAVPMLNRRRQRLGDMLAGTVVVENPKAVLRPDLAMARAAAGQGAAFVFRPEHLGVYGRYELQVLEEILRDPPRLEAAQARMVKVATTIHRKIGFDQPLIAGQEWEFLMAFYRQQREFLESRQLFGDTREDKHHAVKGAG